MSYDLTGIKQPDPTDIATELELLHNADSVEAISKLVPKEPNLDPDCEDCGEEILPKKRRDLGYKKCVYCQEKIERNNRLRN